MLERKVENNKIQIILANAPKIKIAKYDYKDSINTVIIIDDYLITG